MGFLGIFIDVTCTVSLEFSMKKKKGLAGPQKEQRKWKSEAGVMIHHIHFPLLTFLPGYEVSN